MIIWLAKVQCDLCDTFYLVKFPNESRVSTSELSKDVFPMLRESGWKVEISNPKLAKLSIVCLECKGKLN